MECMSSLTSSKVEVFLVLVAQVKVGTIDILRVLCSPETGLARRVFPYTCS